MKKEAFLRALNKRLEGMSAEERARALEFCAESIDDRVEDGMDEEDAVAARGMRALSRPLAADKAIISGESGAATMGALLEVAADEAARAALGLDARARVLLFSTEGDTDPVNYRRVMEEG